MYKILPTPGYEIPLGTVFDIEVPTEIFTVRIALRVALWDTARGMFKFEVYQAATSIGSVWKSARDDLLYFHQYHYGLEISEYPDQIFSALEVKLEEFFLNRGPVYLAKDCEKERVDIFKKLFSVKEKDIKKNKNKGPPKRW